MRSQFQTRAKTEEERIEQEKRLLLRYPKHVWDHSVGDLVYRIKTTNDEPAWIILDRRTSSGPTKKSGSRPQEYYLFSVEDASYSHWSYGGYLFNQNEFAEFTKRCEELMYKSMLSNNGKILSKEHCVLVTRNKILAERKAKLKVDELSTLPTRKEHV